MHVGLSLLITLFFSFSLQAQKADTVLFTKLLNEGKHYKAESIYDSALVLYQQLNIAAQKYGEESFLRHSYYEMASIYYALKQPVFAIENFSHSYKLELKLDISPSKSLDGLARSYHMLWLRTKTTTSYDSALYYYKKVGDSFVIEENWRDAYNCVVNLSLFLFHGKRYEESLKHLKTGFDNLPKPLPNKVFHLWYNYILGMNYWDLGYSESISEYRDSTRKYLNRANYYNDSTISNSQLRFDLLERLGRFYSQEDNNDSVVYFNQKYYQLKEKLYTRDLNEKIMSVREKFNTSQLELEAEQQKLRASEQARIKNLILIIGISLIVVISLILVYVNYKRKSIELIASQEHDLHKREVEKLLQEQELASIQGILSGQEKERKRIAMDLHDRLGSTLSMAKMQFSVLEEKMNGDVLTTSPVEPGLKLLDQAAAEVRTISHDLLSGVLVKFGLAAALMDLAEKINSSTKLHTQVITDTYKHNLSSENELQVYRIIQELVSNAMKHANASELVIQINENKENINVLVEDDGKGFDPNAQIGGIGLTNIKARVAQLNAEIHIDSGKNIGTTISIDIPK